MTQPPDWIANTPSTDAIHTEPPKAGGGFTSAFTPASLFQIGEKLLEGFLAKVVQAIVGVFIPGGSGGAFGQLQAWGIKIAGVVPATIKLFTDILTFNWLAIPGDLLSLAGLGIDAAPLSTALSQSVTSAPAVTFDASSFGSVNTGNPTSYTKPHTTGGAANMGMTVHVAIGPLTPKAYAKGFATVTYNGVALESKGGIDSGHGTNGWLELFTLNGAASGLHDVVVTTAQPVHSIAASINTYAGVGGFSGFVSGATKAESQSLAVRGTPNGVVVVGMAAANAISGASAGTRRTAENVDELTNAGNLIVADAPGADSVTVTAGGTPPQVLIDLNAAVTAGGLSVNVGLAATVTAGGSTVSSFVTRDASTGNLMLNGQRVRFAGANCANDVGTVGTPNGNRYGGVDIGGVYLSTHSQADALLVEVQAMHLNLMKATWSAQSTGTSNSVQTSLGVFNAAALDPLDYFLSQCASKGIKVVVPFAEDYFSKPWYVTATGGGNNDNFYTRPATVNAYKAHISFVLNHVNPYTGLALKADPTILCWQIGNEFSINAITLTQYAAWADDIAQYVKVTEGAQQLVQDGCLGVYPETVISPYIDIYDNHPYANWDTPAFVLYEAQAAHNAGKAFFVGEFDWTDWIQGTGAWTLDQQLDAWERSSIVDGSSFWDLLAPLTIWNDGYTLHYPGDNANMQTRGDMLADYAQRMAGIAPKQFVLDNFTGADGTTLASHVGETGATWDVNDGYADIASIKNNRIWAPSQTHYYASGIPASADYEVSVDIYIASQLSGAVAGVAIRSRTKSDISYTGHFGMTGASAACYILGFPGAGGIGVASVATPAVGSTHNLKLKVQGTSLSLYWDGALVVGPVTNTGYLTAGRAGIFLGSSSATTGFHIDKLTAVDL